MVKFGQKIVALQRNDWAPYYLDYNSLKTSLEEAKSPAAAEQFETASRDSGVLTLLLSKKEVEHPASELFLSLLDAEVEKIVLFFLEEQGRVAFKLLECRQEQAVLMQYGGDLERFQALRVRLNTAGIELLQLIQFVELNVTGIRKILKKHDKFMHWPAARFYLIDGTRRSSHTMKPLLRSESLTALCVTLESALIELRRHEDEITGSTTNTPGQALPQHIRARSDPAAALFPGAVAVTAGTAGTIISAQQHRRNFSTSHHESFMAQRPHPDDAILARIYAAQRRLKQSSEFVELLATTVLLHPSDAISQEGSFNEDDSSTAPNFFSNLLNMLSTFLYMTNYYIIVPTAGSYAEKLGCSKSYASMLVGMTPTAALISTLLYSWWTSYSYKPSLIFASSCSVIGNIFYMLGIPYNSMTLVMIGRFLNGFGSARSINRRYIADNYSHAERTAASATFVAAGALGMAAGPGIASLLHMAADNSLNPYWQVENAPGWFMFFIWSIYLICIIFFFVEPPSRKHHAPAVELTKGHKEHFGISGNGDAHGSGSEGEIKPLLGDSRNDAKPLHSEPPLWKNIAVMTIFLIYFILKLLLECVLSSTAIVTDFYFDWSANVAGIYMASLGLLMLPANFAVASLARSYDDRELIMIFQAAMVFGCLLIMKYTIHYSPLQYVVGSIILFLSTNMLEGPNMSLLSKTIPKSWSRGFFNVGLLATEAGTLGRAVGDSFLTVCGSQGMEYLLNNTFGSMMGMSIVTFLISWRFYGLLQPIDKDE